MGQAINKLVSLTARELKTINIDRRAEKIISKDKPTPAPLHPSSIKELERLKEENVSTEYLHKKDEQLDIFLKKVYVTTPDPAPPLERKINTDRPLPVSRHTDGKITFGYSESEEAAVPEGRVSLKQALTFISNHQTDPKKYSNAAIASQYKLSLNDTDDILEHFKMLDVKVHKKEVDPSTLSPYEKLQQRIQNMTIYNAPEVLKEIRALYGRPKDKEEKENREMSVMNEKVLGENNTSTGNNKKAEEKNDSGTAPEIEKAHERNDSKTKPEDATKTSTIKHRQENG